MKRIFSAKPLVAAAIALGAVVAASAAHARSDVIVSIGFNVPDAHVQPAPVYVQPRPVHVQPRPIYAQPQPIYRGQPRYAQRNGPWAISTVTACPTSTTAIRASTTHALPIAMAAGTQIATGCLTVTTARHTARTSADRACHRSCHCGIVLSDW